MAKSSVTGAPFRVARVFSINSQWSSTGSRSASGQRRHRRYREGEHRCSRQTHKHGTMSHSRLLRKDSVTSGVWTDSGAGCWLHTALNRIGAGAGLEPQSAAS